MNKKKNKTRTEDLQPAEYNKGRLKIRAKRDYGSDNFPISINLPDSDISIAEAKFIMYKLIKILT